MSEPTGELRQTPLRDLHVELGGRLVEFAGWELPIRYEPGPMAEHLHTRESASLFDVSHMGIVELRGPEPAAVARTLETLVPAAVQTLDDGRQRYTLLTNDAGGVIDDLMVARTGGHLTLVVNASRRDVDVEHLRAGLRPAGVEVVERDDLALLAVQGPEAVAAVAELARDPALVTDMAFMDVRSLVLGGVTCTVSRSGYTGEDGVEIQVPAAAAVDLARRLLGSGAVRPAGLAARDSLRLEAGLCLYGHDLDESTTPVEAGLLWSIPRRRRDEGGYPGADVVRTQIASGPPRRRVGLRPTGRQPVRDGAALVDTGGAEVGTVTSGGYGPTVGGPVAMGYLTAGVPDDAELTAVVRGKDLPVRLADLPFVAPRYRRDPAAGPIPQERP